MNRETNSVMIASTDLSLDFSRSASQLISAIQRGDYDAADKSLRSMHSAAQSPAKQAVTDAIHAKLEAQDFVAAKQMARNAARRSDRNAEKIISERFGFLWVCNPKVASRSLIAFVQSIDPDATLVTGQTVDDVLCSNNNINTFFKFSFVRHPYSRIISFYNDKYKNINEKKREYFIAPYYGVQEYSTLHEIIEWLGSPWGADEFADRHWLSQTNQIFTQSGENPYDYLAKFETLADDFLRISEILGLPKNRLPLLNTTSNENNRQGLSKIALPHELCHVLDRRYDADFALLGYERISDSDA